MVTEQQKNVTSTEQNSKGRQRRRNRQTGDKQASTSRERVEFSNPEIEVNYTLHSQEAIRLQQRHYNNTSRSLFTLTINSTHLERLDGKFKGSIERTKKAINDVLAGPEKEIRSGINALQRTLDDASKNGNISEVSYTAPRAYNIKVRTPEAMRLVEIFKNFDCLHMLIDRLWLNNKFNQDEVDDYKTRLRDTIRNMASLLERHALSTVDELNENNGQVAEEQEKKETPPSLYPSNNQQEAATNA
ncbi:AcaB family transcriptional regulator [Photorhabdus luminescens]|uniref:DUF1845 domain-containing protein n=1 Tax=Photorhabdus luminescens subsp. mexicana TaxID=2100167 RepID=A0A4R4IQ02_PHOLU|nr:AcaB family transcriptional regulator [Photorhabdus luminescens]TDB42684.1 hypothetical protein C5468_24430 [Photorhabdus luminescens subsp. mexicana]